jgi:hypothetical protein
VKGYTDCFDYTIKGHTCTRTGKIDGRSGDNNYLYFRKQSDKMKYLRELFGKARFANETGIEDEVLKEQLDNEIKYHLEREEEEQAELLARYV